MNHDKQHKVIVITKDKITEVTVINKEIAEDMKDIYKSAGVKAIVKEAQIQSKIMNPFREMLGFIEDLSIEKQNQIILCLFEQAQAYESLGEYNEAILYKHLNIITPTQLLYIIKNTEYISKHSILLYNIEHFINTDLGDQILECLLDEELIPYIPINKVPAHLLAKHCELFLDHEDYKSRIEDLESTELLYDILQQDQASFSTLTKQINEDLTNQFFEDFNNKTTKPVWKAYIKDKI